MSIVKRVMFTEDVMKKLREGSDPRFRIDNEIGFKNFMGRFSQYVGQIDNDVSNAYVREARALGARFLTTKSDLPTNVAEQVMKVIDRDISDEGWRLIFRELDFRGRPVDSFTVTTITDGIEFREYEDGEKVKFDKFTGSRTAYAFKTYRAATGIQRNVLADNQFLELMDMADGIRIAAAQKRAAIFYALIEAVSSAQNTAWQAPTPATLATTDPNYTAIRDINTINSACQSIIGDLKATAAIPSIQGLQFRLLFPYQLKARVARAFAVQNQSLSNGFIGIQYAVSPIETTMLSSGTSYYIVLPGYKLIAAFRQDLQVESDTNLDLDTLNLYGKQRFNGVIGETKQIRRCATS